MYNDTLAYLTYERDPLAIDVVPPEVPAEVKLLTELDRWRALPLAGGLLDQPMTLMKDLDMVRTAMVHAQQNQQRELASQGDYAALAEKAGNMVGGAYASGS